MALLNEMTETTPLPRPPRRFRYHVLFSYASEDSEYVEAVRAALPKEAKVFDYAEGTMWGERLAGAIERRYKNEAPFCVVFISEDYLAKKWCKKELAIVITVNERKPGYMLPVMRSGDVPEEIKEIVWLETTLSADQVAARIVAKLRDPPTAPLWFFISTRVKVAAAVLLLAVILWFWPSRTTLKSADANAAGIIAHVVNIAPKTSTLVGQRLKFGSLPLEDVELRLNKSGSPTIFPGEHDIKLITFELVPKCGADGFLLTKQKVDPLLGNQPVTLEIDIRESDDAPGKWRRKSVTFPAAHLKPLVERLVSGYDTLCLEYSRLRSARSDLGAGHHD
jgi:hypothetical protein